MSSSKEKICVYCEREFSSKSNNKKHQNICKKNPLNDTDDKRKIKVFEEQKQEIKKLKSIIIARDEKLKEKDEHITLLKSIIETQSRQHPTIINNSNTNTINNTISLTNKIEHLEPINFEEMKQQFINEFSNKYVDKGVEGVAQFICEIPCCNKFITTDYGRKMILFRLSEPKDQVVNDPKASILLNKTIQQNADTIIDKAEDRYQYFLSQIAEAREEDLEPDQSDVDKKNKTRELKMIAQNAKNNIPIDSIDATNVIILKGMENKVIVNGIE